MARILVGFILGLLILPVAMLTWFYRGKFPVAVADSSLPREREIASMALHTRIDKELILMPAVQPSEATFVAGAHVYAAKCAVCHGFHGKSAPIGENMFPVAPPLWEKHHNSPVVGVSDDQPGETYWKVANGIRLTGMPEFRTQLSDTEMWQVSVLLANADKPLPPAVLAILRDEPVRAAAPADAPAKTAKIAAEASTH
jgi:thiosulfate dehydrogenase